MPHVLVVDDQKDICEVLKAGLETAEELYVSCSSSGADAISILEEHQPDFAVVDILIPDISGFAVAQAAVDRGIPVLFMTGNPDTARELQDSYVPHMLKPFRLHTLLEEVRRQLVDTPDNLQRVSAYLGSPKGAPPNLR